MMKKIFILLLCFSAIIKVAANENDKATLTSLKEKISHAITKSEQTKRSLWAYTVYRFEDEEGDISSSIEAHAPLSSSPWTLLKVNGQAPTDKQIEHFIDKKQKSHVKKESDIKLSLRELIHHESLSLTSIDENYIIMEFNVYWEKLGYDSNGKLQGKLYYQQQNEFIEKIVIWNNDEFSPLFTASINELQVTFSFLHINGAVLPKQTEMKMKGSFAYITEINETSIDKYSDYIFQGKKTNHSSHLNE